MLGRAAGPQEPLRQKTRAFWEHWDKYSQHKTKPAFVWSAGDVGDLGTALLVLCVTHRKCNS